MFDKIEAYCDERKLNFSALKKEEYIEFNFENYTDEDVQNFKDIIGSEGIVKEEFECIGTNDIKKSLKIYTNKEAE